MEVIISFKKRFIEGIIILWVFDWMVIRVIYCVFVNDFFIVKIIYDVNVKKLF